MITRVPAWKRIIFLEIIYKDIFFYKFWNRKLKKNILGFKPLSFMPKRMNRIIYMNLKFSFRRKKLEDDGIVYPKKRCRIASDT